MAEPLHADTVHFIRSSPDTGCLEPRLSRPHDNHLHDDHHDDDHHHLHDDHLHHDDERNKIRIVAVSDTHSHPHWTRDIPPGDVFIHCGDLTRAGTRGQLERVWDEIAGLPHRVKLVVAGNHDLGLDGDFCRRHAEALENLLTASRVEVLARDMGRRWRGREATRRGIHYLEHETVTVTVRGRRLRVFGSPLTPAYNGWAFMYPVGEDVWSAATTSPRTSRTRSRRGVKPREKVEDEAIRGSGMDVLTTRHLSDGGEEHDAANEEEQEKGKEEDHDDDDETLIWITHGPAKGILDRVHGIGSVGCPFLLAALERVRPAVHFFGHIHEGAAIGSVERVWDDDDDDDNNHDDEGEGDGRDATRRGGRTTRSVNAALLDENYRLAYPATVVDL